MFVQPLFAERGEFAHLIGKQATPGEQGIDFLDCEKEDVLTRVKPALGNKIIHPFSDFLLHDIGTGDGIPFLPTPEFQNTARQIKTAPLWGLRTRNRLMHDGLSSTKEEAIQRHTNQAEFVKRRFNALPRSERDQIMAFLDSL